MRWWEPANLGDYGCFAVLSVEGTLTRYIMMPKISSTLCDTPRTGRSTSGNRLLYAYSLCCRGNVSGRDNDDPRETAEVAAIKCQNVAYTVGEGNQ
jgi:hypothetical protein